MEKEIARFFTDDEAMALAMQLALAGAPYVSPNPLVGCVVLNSKNEFISSGYHEKYGEAHAEINAIKNLSANDLIDSKIFVTLEPCAHEGKTGSCAKRLAQYKIGKVIYGLVDPNPLVAGQGAAILIAAGIKTEEYQGRHKKKLEDLAEVFLKNFREKKTFVSMKVAASLDGQIALKTGESQWITGVESREFVHELRSWYDAIVVGYNTVERDNPSLNIRHPQIAKCGKLIILDPHAQILKNILSGKKYKFLEAHAIENIYFAVQSEISADFKTIVYSDLNDLMNKIWNLNIKSIFIEGGAKTYSSFFAAGIVDRIHLFINTSVIGSQNGLTWTAGFGIKALSEKLILKNTQTKMFGSDIYITGKI